MGNKTLERKAGKKNKYSVSSVCSQVAKILTLRIEQAKKAQPARWFDCEALGKTGTTNDARTCWFVGATPLIQQAFIWVMINRSLGEEVFGAQTAFPIWREFNRLIKNDIKHFTYDPTLHEVIINAKTGAPCSADNPLAIPLLVAASPAA